MFCYTRNLYYLRIWNVLCQQNIPEVPVKVALPMPVVDNTTVMHHGHPPGLSAPPMPTSSIELLTTLWNRPGFAGTVCGAPEVIFIIKEHN